MLAEKKPNAVRDLRLASGLNQTQFAVHLGLSIATIQNYERGSNPSDTAIDKMQTFAAERGLEELGFKLRPKPFAVRKVFEPTTPRVRFPNPRGRDLADEMHDALDAIIQSGDTEAVASVEALLQVMRRLTGRGGAK